jgi:hypothetical protein
MSTEPLHLGASAPAAGLETGPTRRDFLRRALAGGVAALLPISAAGCADDPFDPTTRATFDLRTDEGLLNALYALTQLKGEFFHRVVQSPFPGMTRAVQSVFSDVRAHAASHARYLTTRIPSSGRIYDYLLFDFSAVDLNARGEVMRRSAEMCDRTAGAWAGVVPGLDHGDTARVVAKMAAVHARHAAAVHDLTDAEGTGFATGTGGDGLVPLLAPAAALRGLEGYFRTSLDLRS